MTKPLHRALLAALLLALLATGPALAQSGNAEADTAEADTAEADTAEADTAEADTAEADTTAMNAPEAEEQETTAPSLASSLTVGYSNTDFFYGGEDRVTPYDFSESPVSLMLSWQQGTLQVSYGRREADSTSARPLLRTVGTSFRLGGDAYLFRRLFEVPLALFIPIRFNANYRYTSVNEETGGTTAPATPPLHLLGSGLGLGAGARLALPPSAPPFVLEASYTVAPGVMGNLGEGLDPAAFEQNLGELRMRRATALDFEIQLKRLFSGSVGVTAGYTLRTVARSQEKPASFANVVDAVIYGGEFVQTTDVPSFRVGINW